MITAYSCSASNPKPRALPGTVPELIDIIENEKDDNPPPTDAIEALGKFGPEASPALPLITPWLDYRGDRGFTNSIVAEVLAKMGPSAAPAVPKLIQGIEWLKYPESIESEATLDSFIAALGFIGPAASESVPILVEMLDTDSSLIAAWSLAQITEQNWPDADLEFEYEHGIIRTVNGYSSVNKNSDGESLLVVAAREWWKSEGQFQR